MVTWTEVTDARDGVVRFTRHFGFADGELRGDAVLRFRTEGELRDSLAQAGFRVQRIHGGWQGEPVGAGEDGEFLVVATAA